MAKRIVIVGNSHLGALAQAESGNARFAEAGHDLLYWGAAGGNFPKIRFEKGKLISSSPSQALMISGGRCVELVVTEADVVVFYACHVILSTQTRRIAMALQEAEGISSAMRATYLDELVARWWLDQFVRTLIEDVRREFPEKPLFLFAHPLEGKHGGFFSRLRDRGVARDVLQRLMAIIDTWAEAHSVTFCPQPQDTIVDDLFTHPIYARGSVKLGQDEKHPDDDYRHMNATYGERILDRLFDLTNPLLKS